MKLDEPFHTGSISGKFRSFKMEKKKKEMFAYLAKKHAFTDCVRGVVKHADTQ